MRLDPAQNRPLWRLVYPMYHISQDPAKTGKNECSSSKLCVAAIRWSPPVLWRRLEDGLASICVLIHSCKMPKESETTGLDG